MRYAARETKNLNKRPPPGERARNKNIRVISGIFIMLLLIIYKHVAWGGTNETRDPCSFDSGLTIGYLVELTGVYSNRDFGQLLSDLCVSLGISC